VRDVFPSAAPIGDDAALSAPDDATLPPPSSPPQRPIDVLEPVADDTPTPPPVAQTQPIEQPVAQPAPSDDRYLWPGSAGQPQPDPLPEPQAPPAPAPVAETRGEGLWPGSSQPAPQEPVSSGPSAFPGEQQQQQQPAPQAETPVVAQAYDRYYRPDGFGYNSVQPHVPTLSRRAAAPAALQGMPGFPATLREGRGVAPIANVGRTLPYGGRRIATRFCDDGSARLSRDDIQALDEVAQLYHAEGGVIRVEGHASRPTRARNRVEHNLINYEISGRRVDAVVAALIRRGVPKSRIGVLALSDNQPEFDDHSRGEAANRRVVIYLGGR